MAPKKAKREKLIAALSLSPIGWFVDIKVEVGGCQAVGTGKRMDALS